ncbi:hypothetical protein [Verrucomicrobium sp. BvORR034]|uniref:hypothetical protein n=1 Tax=Verrucomicrobium sp. BvORR034 TaxID=1396418 RepID=UPI000679DA61|nr:hypothetical protein [Verrucomicrobium sp. BvORR034]
MTILDHSTVQEYARQFWRRESEKGNQDGIHTFADIERGADPVEALRVKHSYKLPRPRNSHVCIAAFTSREEIENLLVHEYMPNDKWMQERELVPSPFTQRLGTLARICLDRGYFTSQRDDRQIRHYRNWKKKGLRDVIRNDERPLVEVSDSGNIEIVDGWERLLPIAAILLEGLAFETIQVFHASPSTKHTCPCATANS